MTDSRDNEEQLRQDLPADTADQLRRYVAAHNETQLRRYLLGQCPPEDIETIELAILVDRQVSDLLSVLEDELTEEYLMGELSDNDRLYFEQQFLSNPQRRQKVRLSAMLLHRQGASRGQDRSLVAVGPANRFADRYGPIPHAPESGASSQPEGSGSARTWVQKRRGLWWLGASASVLAIAFAVAFLFHPLKAPEPSRNVPPGTAGPGPVPAITSVEFAHTGGLTIRKEPSMTSQSTTHSSSPKPPAPAIPPGHETFEAGSAGQKDLGKHRSNVITVPLEITGSDFAPGVLVLWDELVLPTQFVTAFKITVSVPIDVHKSSTAKVVVYGNGQKSAPVWVTIPANSIAKSSSR